MRGIVTFVMCVLATPCWGQGQLENPAPNSRQSGIGLISGWYCNATKIEAVVDNAITVQTSYGTPRGDTQSACGDTNNGFGLLVNWNDLGTGSHTVRMLADGKQFVQVTFTVTTLGASFLRGQSGRFTVNFAGQTVTLEWNESLQNFVIAGMGGTPTPQQNFSGQWFIDATQGQNTCAFATPDKIPLRITNTLDVTQNGTSLTVVSGSVSLKGNVDSTGEFAVVAPPVVDSGGGCTFSVTAGYAGNFVTGNGGLALLADRVSGNCMGLVPCQVVWAGSIRKISALSTEPDVEVEEIIREIKDAARERLGK